MARPKKDINPQQVCKLAKLGATLAEMGDFFGCDPSTLSKRFSKEIAKSKAEMKMKLRRLQWRAAEDGNTSMLIWLGKNLLGQSNETPDEPVTTVTLVFGERDVPEYAQLPKRPTS